MKPLFTLIALTLGTQVFAVCRDLDNKVTGSNLRAQVKAYVEQQVREKAPDDYTEQDIRFAISSNLERKLKQISLVKEKLSEKNLNSCVVVSGTLPKLLPSQDTVFIFEKGKYEYHIHSGQIVGIVKNRK